MENTSQTIQAVIFDLDGVLIDSEWLAFGVWQEWTEKFGGKLEEAAFSELNGTTAEETAVIVQRWAGVEFDIAESCDWTWAVIIERLKDKIEALPGSKELVRALTARGIPIAVASNAFTGYIDNALTGLHMMDYFPVRVGVEQVAEGKPAPDVYLRAAELLGVDPKFCMAIEDSRIGVRAAAAAGMRVLAVPYRKGGEQGFEQAWRIYDSLTIVVNELERIICE